MLNVLRVSSRDLFILLYSICIIIFLMVTIRNKRLEDAKFICHNEINTDDAMETLHIFSSLTEKVLNLTVIEPSILWNLIPYKHDLLKSKGYQAKRYSRNKNIIALAVEEDHVPKLTDITVMRRLEISGFRITVHHTEVGSWANSTEESTEKLVTSHIVYVTNNAILHVVVFRKKEKFLWSWKMNDHITMINGVLQSFVFGQNDTMYDRFQSVPYRPSGRKLGNLFVPSDIPFFLLNVETSSFVPCQNVIFQSISAIENITVAGELLKFTEQTKSVIEELKRILDPLLIRFWLASGTLLGWYRQCGLIPYTNDLDFAIWAKDIDAELIENLMRNSSFELYESLGIEQQDLEIRFYFGDVALDLFFVYADDRFGGLYVGSHRPGFGYSFKCTYPKFELCSTEFLGYRLLVPCNSEEVLEADYGKDWRIPNDNWNYEFSTRNVFGRRYWDIDEIERANND